MKFSETLAKSGIEQDTKARRVVNVSGKIANITADEIENGVTIERLEALNVPCFKYGGQVTIHGKLPEFNELSRPAGYKSILKNENGSVGVKYVAIDGAKKALIVKAFRYAKGRKFHATLNSQGLEIVGQFQEREQAIEAFKTFPRELFAGSVCAMRGMYGEFYVIGAIGAVYAENLWPLITTLTGIASAEALQAEIDAEEKQWAERRAEQDIANAKRDEQIAAQVALKVSQITLPKLNVLPVGECSFVRVNDSGESFLYVVKKKSFGLFYTSCRYIEGMTAASVDLTVKMKRWQDRRASIEKSVAAGRVFAI